MLLSFFQDDPLTAYYIKYTATFNPATGENAQTPTEIPVQAILLDLTLLSNGLTTRYGTEIVAGDKQLYILPPEKFDSTASPLVIDTSTDMVRVGSVTYKVFHMKEINPSAASPLVYDLHIRR